MPSQKGLPVRGSEIDQLRRQAHDIVRYNMPAVRDVLDGKKKWSATQVRLFGMMINKVLPDLSHAALDLRTNEKALDEMTVEELEKYVLELEATAIPDDGPTDRDDRLSYDYDIDDSGNQIPEEPDVEADQPPRPQEQ